MAFSEDPAPTHTNNYEYLAALSHDLWQEGQRRNAIEQAKRSPQRIAVREDIQPDDPKDFTESPEDYFARVAAHSRASACDD